MRLLIGTNNIGKQAEIADLLEGLEIEIIFPAQIGLRLKVEEDGGTYLANARLKARAFAHESGMWTLADDSGLEVDALDGAPGLYSARFAPLPEATDRDRRAYLLSQLSNIPGPWKAHFTCTAVLCSPTGETINTHGVCPGEIIPEERGEGGFGYDPIFFIPGKNRTMAELSMEEKNVLSHRARAVREMIPVLRKLIQPGKT